MTNSFAPSVSLLCGLLFIAHELLGFHREKLPEELQSFRGDLPPLPINNQETFDRLERGERIQVDIPGTWKIMPGDQLFYEGGAGIFGFAKVVFCICTTAQGDTRCTFERVG